VNLKLDKQAAQALTNLRVNPDFKQVLTWLEGHRSKFFEECSTAEGRPLYRAQGKVFVVNGIFEAFGSAPETTEKFKQER